MQNKQADIKEIQAAIEHAGCYNAPAAAAVEAAKVLDNIFVVIHRDELPEVKLRGWGKFSVAGQNYSENANVQGLLDVAYRYLAAAEHAQKVQAESEKRKETEKAQKEHELMSARYHVYRELFPQMSESFEVWSWDERNDGTKKAISEILKLRKELQLASMN